MTTYREYAALPGVNWSSLKALRVSPMQYAYEKMAVKPDSSAFRIGRAIHTGVLEPDEFATRHPTFHGAVRRGVKWEEFQLDHPDAHFNDILIESEILKVQGAIDACRFEPIAAQHFVTGSVAEESITWTDADTGVLCKARCDLFGEYLVELKSSADIAPHKFVSTAAQLGYHGQIAFYLDGLRSLGKLPEDGPDPVIVAVQSVPPHDVVVYRVPEAVVYFGRLLYQDLLVKLVECEKNQRWPGIGADKELMLTLPAWAEEESYKDADEPITIGGVAVEV